jgi:hypothetical protein
MFLLENPQDPQPKGVYGKALAPNSPKKNGPEHDGRHLGNVDQNKLFVACMYNDGTMYWQGVADKDLKFPMTEKQVDGFNDLKGAYYEITNPESTEWVFTSPEQEQQYMKDAQAMNLLADFLQANHRTQRPVFSQSFQTVIIGPRFTHGEHTGEQETVGRMMHPHTYVDDNGGNGFIGKRGDWVIVKKEYNTSSLAQRVNMPAQAASGNGPFTTAPELKEAVSEVYRLYRVPAHVLPNPQEIQAAQQAFDAAQQSHAGGGNVAVVDNETRQTTFEPQPTVVDNSQQQQPQQPAAPQQPQPTAVNPSQPQQIEDQRRQVPNSVMANGVSPLSKTSADIINKLKRNK